MVEKYHVCHMSWCLSDQYTACESISRVVQYICGSSYDWNNMSTVTYDIKRSSVTSLSNWCHCDDDLICTFHHSHQHHPHEAHHCSSLCKDTCIDYWSHSDVSGRRESLNSPWERSTPYYRLTLSVQSLLCFGELERIFPSVMLSAVVLFVDNLVLCFVAVFVLECFSWSHSTNQMIRGVVKCVCPTRDAENKTLEIDLGTYTQDMKLQCSSNKMVGIHSSSVMHGRKK